MSNIAQISRCIGCRLTATMRERYKGCIIESIGRDLLEGIVWVPVCTIQFKNSADRIEVKPLYSDQTCGTEEKAIFAGIANAKRIIDSTQVGRGFLLVSFPHED